MIIVEASQVEMDKSKKTAVLKKLTILIRQVIVQGWAFHTQPFKYTIELSHYHKSFPPWPGRKNLELHYPGPSQGRDSRVTWPSLAIPGHPFSLQPSQD